MLVSSLFFRFRFGVDFEFEYTVGTGVVDFAFDPFGAPASAVP
jgi:hypothetical protein